MKAPEKIYFSSTENGTHYYTEGIPFEREYIEYIRTDAFIEKACDWMKENLIDYWSGINADSSNFINDFKRAMGE